MNTVDPSNGACPAGRPAPGALPDPGMHHLPPGGQEAAPIQTGPWAPTQTGQWAPGHAHASWGLGPMSGQPPVAPGAAPAETAQPGPDYATPAAPQLAPPIAPEAAPTQTGQPGPGHATPAAPQLASPIAPEAAPTQGGQPTPTYPTPMAPQLDPPAALAAAPPQPGHWAPGAATGVPISGSVQQLLPPVAALPPIGHWTDGRPNPTNPGAPGQNWAGPNTPIGQPPGAHPFGPAARLGQSVAPEAAPTQGGQPTPPAPQLGLSPVLAAAPTQTGQWAPGTAGGAPIPGSVQLPLPPEAAATQTGPSTDSQPNSTNPRAPGQIWANPNTSIGQPPGAHPFGPVAQPFGSVGPDAAGGAPGGAGRLFAFGAAAMAVVAVGVGVVAVTVSGSDEASASDGSTPSMVSALTTGESASKAPRSTTTRSRPADPSPDAELGPIVPGFQPVAVPNRSAAYDVPAGWRVAPEGSVGGFGEPPEAVVGTGLASDGVDYCPGSTRTVAFLTGSDTADPAKAATELGTKSATIAYAGSRDVSPGAAQPLASADGSQQGMLVETTGKLDSAKPGCANQFSVFTYAVPARTGTTVLVLAADTGVPGAVDLETAKRVLTSIRPLKP